MSTTRVQEQADHGAKQSGHLIADAKFQRKALQLRVGSQKNVVDRLALEAVTRVGNVADDPAGLFQSELIETLEERTA